MPVRARQPYRSVRAVQELRSEPAAGQSVRYGTMMAASKQISPKYLAQTSGTIWKQKLGER